MSPDSLKEIKAEERAYALWERETKNHILNIKNEERKQAEWNKLFPPMRPLEANEIY